MNRAGASKFAPRTPQEDDEAYVREVYEEWLEEQWNDYVATGLTSSIGETVFGHGKPSTLGYVTKDACRGRGDDIEHIPAPFSRYQVDFIQTPMPDVDPKEDIDVVVMDFAMADFCEQRRRTQLTLVTAAKVLAPERGISLDEFELYAEGTLINEVFGRYARIAW
jgi:hypothetical protein